MKTVRMTLANGEKIYVEVEENEVVESRSADGGFRSPMGAAAGNAAVPAMDFSAAISRIREPIETIMAKLNDLPVVPDKLSVEFSVKFTTEGGVIFASAKAEGGLVIKLEWSPQAKTRHAGSAA